MKIRVHAYKFQSDWTYVSPIDIDLDTAKRIELSFRNSSWHLVVHEEHNTWEAGHQISSSEIVKLFLNEHVKISNISNMYNSENFIKEIGILYARVADEREVQRNKLVQEL